MRISRGGFDVRHHLIVEVVTDEGITGLGEGVGDARLIQKILLGSMVEQVLGPVSYTHLTLPTKA